jgi:trehalose 6-phosphate synthase
MGEAFFAALTMPVKEQRERMRRMRDVVRSNNVYRWAGNMLLDAARLRKQDQLREVANGASSSS